jgi:hypothetical protein
MRLEIDEKGLRINPEKFTSRRADVHRAVGQENRLIAKHLAPFATGEAQHARRSARAFEGVKTIAS